MKQIKRILTLFLSASLICGLNSCKDDPDPVIPADYEETPEAGSARDGIIGMYLLNEGNMGSNKCTLDFLDFNTGFYARNIYPERNPEVVLELGDTGNDEIIADGRLFISVSGSNKMEVLDAATAKRIGEVNIANCRMLAAGDGYVYAGSYTGAIEVDPAQEYGKIYKIDAKTLSIAGTLSIAYWPEGMSVAGGKLYVATSGTAVQGAYPANDVLVVDPSSMTIERKVSVGPNLNKLKSDDEGNLWVSSRGDYVGQPSRLYRIEPAKNMAVTEIPTDCTDFAIYKGVIYYYASVWNNATFSSELTYGKVDMASASVLPGSFLSDGAKAEIAAPYGIAVNPVNGDIYVSDAKNYVSSGALFCFRNNGEKKWSVNTGDIPGHMIFLRK